jgi:molecular chaperone DnaK
MSDTVNFGIDLGTTNSLIAKHENGNVVVFKNPAGHKETLPSVVAYRNKRILVGDKAREFVLRDSQNVKGSFKRKMGTSEKFFIPSIGKEVSPIELSSLVLKELKGFDHTGESMEEVVITIPASFDTVQSNATKQAGAMAGFKQVFLLQEPIAACLAFLNSQMQEKEIKEGCWIVYDLGGGTFDTALVKIKDGELKVIDHEGNNFLGGNDFDGLIVDHLFLPKLQAKLNIPDLEQELKTAHGKYNALYYKMLRIAEDVKVELSQFETTEVDFDFETDQGRGENIYFEISKSEFEDLIRPYIQETINQTLTIIERNEFTSDDINELFLVGGSTFIPLVRKMLAESLGIALNTTVDPTNAVVCGAAYYAGTKRKSEATNSLLPKGNSKNNFDVKMAYQKVSQDDHEYFAAKILNYKQASYYRIIRSDSAFDSGLKPLDENIAEMLPLLPNESNRFSFKIFDVQNNCLFENNNITIVHGKYGVIGQPLPEDICIELDDPENSTTKLELVFSRNSILPVKRTLVKEVMKPVRKNSGDSIIINLLEGPHNSNPSSNKSIGIIEIKGCDLERDIAKRSDIEITIEITESRDVKINTYLNMSDQEFEDVFSASERTVNLAKLKDELNTLRNAAREEIHSAQKNEGYEIAAILVDIETEVNDLFARVTQLSPDDFTDKRYQFEDQKRKLAQKLFNTTNEKKLFECISDYYKIRETCKSNIDPDNPDPNLEKYNKIIGDEKKFIASGNIHLIKRKRDELRKLNFGINWEKPEYVIMLYYHYKSLKYPDQVKANQVISDGENALMRKNYDELRSIINILDNLLPDNERKKDLKGTGIG